MKEPIILNRMGSDTEIEHSVLGDNLIKGSTMIYQAGKFGNGFYCQQNSGSAYTVICPQIPDNFSVPLAAMSFGFWFKRTDAWVNANSRYMEQSEAGSAITMMCNTSFDFQIVIKSDNTHYNLYKWEYVSSAAYFTAICPLNTWVYLHILHDDSLGSGNKIKLYRDGNFIAQTATTTETFTGTPASMTSPIILGGYNASYMGGIMDNFAIWDYVNTDMSGRNAERGYLNDSVSTN